MVLVVILIKSDFGGKYVYLHLGNAVTEKENPLWCAGYQDIQDKYAILQNIVHISEQICIAANVGMYKKLQYFLYFHQKGRSSQKLRRCVILLDEKVWAEFTPQPLAMLYV